MAGDGGEGGNGGTEVFREEVGGGAVMEAEADTGEGSGSLCEGLKMTEIGHEGRINSVGKLWRDAGYRFFDLVETSQLC